MLTGTLRRLVLLPAALLALAPALVAQSTRPARIRVGDEVTVYVYGDKEISGTYVVQNDGSIYPPRVGRLIVAGLTATEAQARLIARLRTFLVEPTATFSITKQRGNAVFVVGGTEGVVPFGPETDLRQVYAAAGVKEDPDLIQVGVFRNGRRIATMSATDLTSGRPGVFSGPLQPNDLVVFELKPYMRVWVVGTVQKGGKLRLNQGDDVYRAIAEAGDVRPETADGIKRLRSEYTVTVRRGPETIRVPLVPDPTKAPLRLEDGDTVSVQPPTQVRVTFTGYARNPGERVYREGTRLSTAVGEEGGAAPATASTTGAALGGLNESEGTLRGVVLFHNGVASIHDLGPTTRGPNAEPGPTLADGDVVYVPRNERTFYALGSVGRPGRVTMDDNRTYRLTDAVAEAGGVTAAGTLTRVSLARPGPDGKLIVKTYRLDKFVKGGDERENPILQPKDVVYVDTSRGLSFSSLTSAISAGLLLNNLTK